MGDLWVPLHRLFLDELLALALQLLDLTGGTTRATSLGRQSCSGGFWCSRVGHLLGGPPPGHADLLLPRGEQFCGPPLLLKCSQLKFGSTAGRVLALGVSVGPAGGVLPGEQRGGSLPLDNDGWMTDGREGGHTDGGSVSVDADGPGELGPRRTPGGCIQNLVQVADLLHTGGLLNTSGATCAGEGEGEVLSCKREKMRCGGWR